LSTLLNEPHFPSGLRTLSRIISHCHAASRVPIRLDSFPLLRFGEEVSLVVLYQPRTRSPLSTLQDKQPPPPNLSAAVAILAKTPGPVMASAVGAHTCPRPASPRFSRCESFQRLQVSFEQIFVASESWSPSFYVSMCPRASRMTHFHLFWFPRLFSVPCYLPSPTCASSESLTVDRSRPCLDGTNSLSTPRIHRTPHDHLCLIDPSRPLRF